VKQKNSSFSVCALMFLVVCLIAFPVRENFAGQCILANELSSLIHKEKGNEQMAVHKQLAGKYVVVETVESCPFGSTIHHLP